MRSTLLFPLSISLLALVSACKHEKPERDSKPWPDRRAPEAVWTRRLSTHELHLGSIKSMELFCCKRDAGGGLSVTAFADSSVEAGSTDGVPWDMATFKTGASHFTVDLRERFADIELDKLKPPKGSERAEVKMPLDIPVTIKLKHTVEVKTAFKATVDVEPAIYAFMASVKDGPAVFAEDPKSDRVDAVVMIWRDLFSVHKTGEAKVLRDVDWVGHAVAIDLKKTKKCSGYARWGSSLPESVTFALYDMRVDIYDRRTGVKVGDKTFPPGACPKSASIGDGKPMLAANTDTIEAWLGQRVKLGKL